MSDKKDPQNFVEMHLKYLAYRGWKVDTYFDAQGFHFHVSHADGSSLSDSFDGLVLLYNTLREEDDDLNPADTISDEALLKEKGYYMICESPLELEAIYDDRVKMNGFPARLFLDDLRQKYRSKKS